MVERTSTSSSRGTPHQARRSHQIDRPRRCTDGRPTWVAHRYPRVLLLRTATLWKRPKREEVYVRWVCIVVSQACCVHGAVTEMPWPLSATARSQQRVWMVLLRPITAC